MRAGGGKYLTRKHDAIKAESWREGRHAEQETKEPKEDQVKINL